MARIKHPDTFRCDICGTEVDQYAVFHAELPVMFTTNQNDGKPHDPYVDVAHVDLCPDCLDRCVTVEASGMMGVNKYRWRAE